MQTFIPLPEIKASVQCLDDSRLGNQIYNECIVILRTLKKGPTTEGKKTPWYNHPAVKMWFNHKYFLCEYIFAGLTELSYRGRHYPNTFDEACEIQRKCRNTGPPIWWGREDIHLSHQSNLVQKDREHYRRFFPDVADDLPYVWPEYDLKTILKFGNDYYKKSVSH